jgi:hypothetical protein
MPIQTIPIRGNAEERFNMMCRTYGRVFGQEQKNQLIFKNTKALRRGFSLFKWLFSGNTMLTTLKISFKMLESWGIGSQIKEMMLIFSKSKRRSTIFRLRMSANFYRMFGIVYQQVKSSICRMRKFSWRIIDVRNILRFLQDSSKRI